MRRGLVIGAAALVTVAAILGLLAFFNARDDSTIGEDRVAPGKADEALTAEELKRGNVVLLYSRPAHRASLEALAELAAAAGVELTERERKREPVEA